MNQHADNLRSLGIHPSYQRVRILGFLRSCQAQDFFRLKDVPNVFAALTSEQTKDYHPTAEQIHTHLVNEIPTLSKTTVYNTLKLFEDKGLISSVMVDSSGTQGSHGALRYDRYPDVHAHLLCHSCGELLDLAISPELQSQLEMLCQPGSGRDSWQLIFHGSCESCNLLHYIA